MSTPPRIFVFCNGCSHEWHTIAALSEDGHFLAGHICSSHHFIPHDMGVTSDWKHEEYRKHYPDGFEVVLADDPRDSRVEAAYQKHLALGEKQQLQEGLQTTGSE